MAGGPCKAFCNGARKYADTIFRWKGSVLPYSALFAMPSTIATAVLHYTWNPDLKGSDNPVLSGFGNVWGAYTFALGFLIVFRNNQAYSRFMEGASKVQEIRAELHNCASILIAFCNAKDEAVEDFRQLLVRLIGLLFATCMSELTASEDGDEMMQVIDLMGIDGQSLKHLRGDHSHESRRRQCEVIVHWIMCLIKKSLDEGILKGVPPPILNKAVSDLAIVDIYRVRKIKEVPVPLPYSQMVLVMLTLYALVTPLIASQMVVSSVAASLATFCVATAFWSLFHIASEIDDPFGNDSNDLDMAQLTEDFYLGLLHLMKPQTHAVPPFARPSKEIHLKKVRKNDHIGESMVAAEVIEVIVPVSDSCPPTLQKKTPAKRRKRDKPRSELQESQSPESPDVEKKHQPSLYGAEFSSPAGAAQRNGRRASI